MNTDNDHNSQDPKKEESAATMNDTNSSFQHGPGNIVSPHAAEDNTIHTSDTPRVEATPPATEAAQQTDPPPNAPAIGEEGPTQEQLDEYRRAITEHFGSQRLELILPPRTEIIDEIRVWAVAFHEQGTPNVFVFINSLPILVVWELDAVRLGRGTTVSIVHDPGLSAALDYFSTTGETHKVTVPRLYSLRECRIFHNGRIRRVLLRRSAETLVTLVDEPPDVV